MLLAIDVGNSETTIGLFDGDKIVRTFRLATRMPRTSDEYALALSGLLELSGFSVRGDVTAVAVASVVPSVTAALRDMVPNYMDIDPLIVEPGIRTGVGVLIDNPKEVGADRIANSVAAHALHGGPAIVIDMGTATTFDIVSVDGEYMGGSIAPGLDMWSEVLVTGTAQLKRVELVWPKRLIGKSTTEALQSGIVIGYASFIDGMIVRFRDELAPQKPVTVLSGGLAEVFAPNLSGVDIVDPWLTLHGLRLLADLNSDTGKDR